MSTSFVVVPRGGAAVVPPSTTRRRRLPEHDALAPLRTYLSEPNVTDVFVNGTRGLFVDRGHGAERVPEWSADDEQVRALAVALVGLGGRHLDDAKPTFRHISHLEFSVLTLYESACGQMERGARVWSMLTPWMTTSRPPIRIAPRAAPVADPTGPLGDASGAAST